MYKEIGNVKSSKPVKAYEKIQYNKRILDLELSTEFNSFIIFKLNLFPKKYFKIHLIIIYINIFAKIQAIFSYTKYHMFLF